MRVSAKAVGSLVGVGVGVGLLLTGGCAYGEIRQVVRAHFASEFDCPEVLLKKRELWYSYEGPDQFKAIGCGHVRTYTCPNEGTVSYDDQPCTFVEGDADAPKTAAMTEESDVEEGAPPVDDSGDAPEPSDDDTSGGDNGASEDDDSGDDLGGGADAEGSSSSSSSHGGASGSGKASGKIKLGLGK